MSTLVMTKRIEAPVELVFEAATDFENMAERIEGIEKIEMLTEGPVGVGTRFRETRIMFKREATEEFEVTQFEPNKQFTMESNSCGAYFSARHDFTPHGDKVEVKLTMEMRPVTLMAKLMSPLGKLMLGSMKKAIEKDLDQLKSNVESRVRS